MRRVVMIVMLVPGREAVPRGACLYVSGSVRLNDTACTSMSTYSEYSDLKYWM